ncbi:MAGEB4 [Cervus elaphus hippelaphus]|uniref:MAGEB4 n=1 Tax=Cervus elaphus hippelaphus TaxID=46360 RepID=A0A212C0T9_CEREH|nr:MAGEB4 [Cervus elaphus hippelaphus]
MPRRHKNKYHDCLKCHQVWRDTQRPVEAQPILHLSSPEVGARQNLQGAVHPTKLLGGLCRQDLMKVPRASFCYTSIKWKMHYKADMVKAFQNKYQDQFPEILRRPSEWMELVFDFE